jgi:6-pyruvoyltetrahydropterin/6-carboxytetrahydropterin synthase
MADRTGRSESSQATSLDGDNCPTLTHKKTDQTTLSRNVTFECELSQHFFFEAAHTLQRTIEAETSRRIHGHTYEAEVTVRGVPDKVSGMVMDIAHLRSEIARVREMLDHRLLDEIPELGPPTMENLCAFIHDQLQEALPGLHAITVQRRASGDRCVLRCGRNT